MAESSEMPAPGRKAAADAAELERCLAVAAKSQSPETREMAASHYAREAKRKAARRKKRLTQEAIDLLLAGSTDPSRRPLRPLSRELVDRLLRNRNPEEREEFMAVNTIVVLNFQAYLDKEDELLRMYYEKGYAEVEVDDDDDDTNQSLPVREALTDLWSIVKCTDRRVSCQIS